MKKFTFTTTAWITVWSPWLRPVVSLGPFLARMCLMHGENSSACHSKNGVSRPWYQIFTPSSWPSSIGCRKISWKISPYAFPIRRTFSAFVVAILFAVEQTTSQRISWILSLGSRTIWLQFDSVHQCCSIFIIIINFYEMQLFWDIQQHHFIIRWLDD